MQLLVRCSRAGERWVQVITPTDSLVSLPQSCRMAHLDRPYGDWPQAVTSIPGEFSGLSAAWPCAGWAAMVFAASQPKGCKWMACH